jgi:hypothetical protein
MTRRRLWVARAPPAAVSLPSMAERKKTGGRSKSKAKASKSTKAEVHRGSGVGEHEGFEPSDVDAMGRDKRRQVVGHSYGPSRKSQVIFFVAVAALLVIVIGGYALAIAAFDQPPDSNPDAAPWSEVSDDPENAAEQAAAPEDPSGPCGEPGNVYPVPADSPCATDVTSENEPPTASKGTGGAQGQEQGSGGVTNSGGEAGSSGGTAEGQ